MSFAESTTYLYKKRLYCEKCAKSTPHYHIHWDYLCLWKCVICDSITEDNSHESELLSPTPSDPSTRNMAGQDHLTPLRSILSGVGCSYRVFDPVRGVVR
jgi:hypothetical protein